MKQSKTMTYVDIPADESVDREYEAALSQLMDELGKEHPLFIGGKEVTTGSQFEVHAPFDRKVLVGTFQNCAAGHINTAVALAKKGFETWSRLSWENRIAILERTADILEKRKFLLSCLITYESGKNRYEAIAETSEAIDMIRYHCGIYREHQGFIIPMQPETGNATSVSVMRPYGVFAVISPFNFPLSLVTGMASAALITGNSVILKPTSTAPTSCLMLYRACIESGVPPDAVHYLTGPGNLFGDIITGHPDIAGIAFTGSRDVGKWLQHTFQERQPYSKPVISEMGSKNPVIITGHADVDKAAEGVFRSAFGYSGQKCSATSRVYAHEAIFGPFLDSLREKTEATYIGDPRLKETFISPLIDRHAVETFENAVFLTRNAGGTIVTGGKVLKTGIYKNGYFVQPTIVTEIPEDHFLMNNELFVPFIIINMFRTLQEALLKANRSDYGLTAGIFSENDEEIAYFFEAIQSGVTYANRRGGATTGAWPGTQPFGGWKASGSTGKGVGGPYYLLSYLREQARTRVR